MKLVSYVFEFLVRHAELVVFIVTFGGFLFGDIRKKIGLLPAGLLLVFALYFAVSGWIDIAGWPQRQSAYYCRLFTCGAGNPPIADVNWERTDCDRFATREYDRDAAVGVPPIPFAQIDAAAAIAACDRLVQLDTSDMPRRIQFQLGRAYQAQGEFLRARENYEIAAQAQSAAAMLGLASLHLRGNGVPKSYELASHFMNEAAEQSDVLAMYDLAVSAIVGEIMAKDYALAFRWLMKADELGYVDATDLLGQLYMRGKGVAQDYDVALQLFRKGAAKGYADSLLNVGFMYSVGLGVTADFGEAREYYELAADLGNAAAMYNLGVMYDNGRGVPVDVGQARGWYEKAAARGHGSAMTNLGSIFHNGDGVEKDEAAAAAWYQKAADAGDELGLELLSRYYAKGLGGLPQDTVKADLLGAAALAKGLLRLHNENWDRLTLREM